MSGHQAQQFQSPFELSSLLHPGYGHDVLRNWQTAEGRKITKDSIIYPVFVTEKNRLAKEPIASLPGLYRFGVDALQEHLAPLVAKGLQSVILFGIPNDDKKDPFGTAADDPEGPVIQATKAIRSAFPQVFILCDLCLCEYTSHGHCGYLNDDGSINNKESIDRLAQVAVNYAKAGCHMIAPSDMMDGRIRAIKHSLNQNGFGSKVSVMSYSAKFASVFYGPFRDAAGSVPAKGSRCNYQLPPGGRGLARRALIRDAQEGADAMIVKPGYPYLDIVRDAKELLPDLPLCVYQVSGEYAMLYYAAENNVGNLKDLVLESLLGAYRAGANIVITYYAPQLMEWLD